MSEQSGQGLDLKSDRGFQEKVWLLKRVGWVLMAAMVLAALAGLTGKGGPLAHDRTVANGTIIDFPRISRWKTADHLSVEFAPGTIGRGEILLPHAFTNVFSIESVTPAPAQVLATPEGQLFRFDLSNARGRKSVQFAVRAGYPAWWTRGAVRLGDGSSAQIGFIVLP